MAPDTFSHRAPKAPESAPQVKVRNMAISLKGSAMSDGMMARKGHQVIRARSTSRSEYSKVIEKHDGTIFRSSAPFTKAEMAAPFRGTRKYLIVGYTPRDVTRRDHLEKNEANGKGNTMSIGKSKSAHFIPWDSVAPPILVVTQVPPQEEGVMKFWALLDPRDGLCTPYAIRTDKVFFRWEFRTLTSAGEKKKAAWIKSVEEAVMRMGGSSPPTSLGAPLSSNDNDNGFSAPNGRSPRRFSASTHRSIRGDAGGMVDQFEDSPFQNGYGGASPSNSDPSKESLARALNLPKSPKSRKTLLTSTQGSRAAFDNTAQGEDSADDESVTSETLRAAKELQRIARRSVKAERARLLAEKEAVNVKEEAIDKWQASLTREKGAFDRGLSFQTRKLTERETAIENREQQVHQRERHVHIQENNMKTREERNAKLEEKLGGWEAILTERELEISERESLVQVREGKLVATEQSLETREAAVAEDQKTLDESVAGAIKTLTAVKKSRKRRADSDTGSAPKRKKNRKATGNC